MDDAFEDGVKPETRTALLESTLPELSEGARATLEGLTAERWAAVKAEASRVLDLTEQDEVRDSDVEHEAIRPVRQMAGLDTEERALAAEIIAPLVVANCSFSPELTNQARVRAADGIAPVMRRLLPERDDRPEGPEGPAARHRGDHSSSACLDSRPDFARLGGWLLLSSLVVGLLLGLALAVPPPAVAPDQRAGAHRPDRRGHRRSC